MSIENISMTIDGVEMSIKNATSKQLADIFAAFHKEVSKPEPEVVERSPIPKKKTSEKSRIKSVSLRNRVRPKIENYQLGSSVVTIDDGFDIDAAINHKIVSKSFDTGKALSKSSKQLEARREIVWVFAINHNTPLNISDICQPLTEKLNLSFAAISNYVSQCSRLGVLAKDEKEHTYYLSEWFIGKVQQK
ncbi:MAG: hypothetical protein ACTH7L_13875 [Psychrobacter alimentarius]